ncbi:unnamed protein product, partial [Mesorhabditis spiculigera]
MYAGRKEPGFLPDLAPNQRCSECQRCCKDFKNGTEFYWHVEECVQYAFENELLNTFDEFSAAPHTHAQVSQPVAGIVARSLQNHHGGELAEVADILEAPSQLPSNLDPMPLDDELPSTSDAPPVMDYGGVLMEEAIGEPEPFAEDDDLDFSNPSIVYANTFPKVIGALANAEDDTNRQKMECPACGLKLYRHNYATHYRVHTGELPFPCHYCDKRFRNSSSRRVHERTHTGERPYKCPHCDYATLTKANIDRHIYNNHVKENPRRTTQSRREKIFGRDDHQQAANEKSVTTWTDATGGASSTIQGTRNDHNY